MLFGNARLQSGMVSVSYNKNVWKKGKKRKKRRILRLGKKVQRDQKEDTP